MRIATWNVNSVRARLPRVLAWLASRQPDVVCLQETKVVDDDFPLAEIGSVGYHAAVFGQKTYNGVAILSREAPTEVVCGLPNDPPEAERRIVFARVGGIHVASVYAPNGGEVNSDKYAAKLVWYDRLRRCMETFRQPGADILLCGDFNVAPEDRDVWDPELWRGQTLFSEPEKKAWAELVGWGLVDCLRIHHAEAGLHTWWDYRMGAFHRGWGVRIDHVLATGAMATRCRDVVIDRDERKGEKPSDHAPVIATFD
jgi:exodeoxyribonuclease-3